MYAGCEALTRIRPFAMPSSHARPLRSVTPVRVNVFVPASTTASTSAPLTGRPVVSDTTVTRTAAVPVIGTTVAPGGGGGGGGGGICASKPQARRHQTRVIGG